MITGFMGHDFSIFPDRFGRYGCRVCTFKIWLIYTRGQRTGEARMMIGYRVPAMCTGTVTK